MNIPYVHNLKLATGTYSSSMALGLRSVKIFALSLRKVFLERP